MICRTEYAILRQSVSYLVLSYNNFLAQYFYRVQMSSCLFPTQYYLPESSLAQYFQKFKVFQSLKLFIIIIFELV